MPTREYMLAHYRQVRIDARDVEIGHGLYHKPSLLELVHERAGICATIVRGPERAETGDYFSVWVDVPSPEGLLL